MEGWFSLNNLFGPGVPLSSLAADRHFCWTRFCLQACAFAGGIAQENLRAIMAPRIFAPTLFATVQAADAQAPAGEKRLPLAQNPLEPSTPTLNPMPNHISLRVTRALLATNA
jgi:hypothetical protein